MKIRHLTEINDLDDNELKFLVEQALHMARRIGHGSFEDEPLSRPPVGLVFMEASTRTRASFERAAQLTGRPSILIESKGSSFEKGESLEDTLLNLHALDIKSFVVRTPNNGELQSLKELKPWSLVSGGDGTHEHPTQALLDFATLLRARADGVWGGLRGLRLAIVGDLRHSRVAGSWAKLAPRVGIELKLYGPKEWAPESSEGRKLFSDRPPDLSECDAVMALRVQKERLEGGDINPGDYTSKFQISETKLGSRLLLHPGPVNWGVELHNDLRNSPRSLILQQVQMGLALRASVLDNLGVA